MMFDSNKKYWFVLKTKKGEVNLKGKVLGEGGKQV